jgi:hypothetical protein
MSRGNHGKDKMEIEFHVSGGKRVFDNLANDKSAGDADAHYGPKGPVQSPLLVDNLS